MQRLGAILLAGLFALVLQSASGVYANVASLIITTNDNAKTVSAVVRQGIQVQLRSNPSTGFTWLLTSTNGTSVAPTGDSTYVPDPGGATGSGGTLTIPLRAMQPGSTTLVFSYVRPWAPTDVAEAFTVTITVAGQALGPRLFVGMGGTNVVVSWPRTVPNSFYLEGSRALSTGWAALNALPLPDGTNYTVALPPTGERLFYRLRQ